jgi:hypothetical protein
LALDVEPVAVAWVWVDEAFCFVWEFAAAFFPDGLDVVLLFAAPLPDLAGLFAAPRLAVLAELFVAAPLDPLLDPAEAFEDAAPDELPVPDEFDEDAGAAALGGGGATGVEITDSRPTRGHSLRPDAL